MDETPAWAPCIEDPRDTLPAALPLPPTGEGSWFRMVEPPAGELVLACRTGDGGAGGPTTLTLYIVPEAPLATDAAPVRYPTLQEVWAVVNELVLAGALMAPVGALGQPVLALAGAPPPPPSRIGTAFQLRQLGALEGSPAARRFMLAHGSKVVQPDTISRIRGL